MPAVMAYAADMTTEEERAKGIGFINASFLQVKVRGKWQQVFDRLPFRKTS